MNCAAAVATRRGQGDGTATADVIGAGAGNILTAALLKLCGKRGPLRSLILKHGVTQFRSHETAQATVTYRDKWQLLVGCQQCDIRELRKVQEKQREIGLP